MASKKTTSKSVVKSTKTPVPPSLQSDMIRRGTKRNSFIKTKHINLDTGERKLMKEATVYTVGKRSIEPHNKNSKKTDVLLKQNLYYKIIHNPKFKDSANGNEIPYDKVLTQTKKGIKLEYVPLVTLRGDKYYYKTKDGQTHEVKGRIIRTRKDEIFKRLNAKELKRSGLSESIQQVAGGSVARAFKEGTKQINRARARYKEDYKVQSRWY